MHLATLLLATAVSAAPLAERQITTEYAPWQITNLYTFKPSGRPNNDPHSKLSLTITDPNTINLQKVKGGYAVFPKFSANCTVSWIAPDVPYGIEQPCEGQSYGNFTVKIVPGSGEEGYQKEGDFGLEFKEVREVEVYSELYQRTFEGSAKFKTGVNLVQSCGASGVCGWNLKEQPFLLQQTLTKSVGSCEEAAIGGC